MANLVLLEDVSACALRQVCVLRDIPQSHSHLFKILQIH